MPFRRIFRNPRRFLRSTKPVQHAKTLLRKRIFRKRFVHKKSRSLHHADFCFFFFGSSRKVGGANKDLGEATKSCTRKEHESATNSIAKRGQGAIAPCRVKGQRPLWGLGQRPNCFAGDQHLKRTHQRRRQRSVPASNFARPQTRPQAALPPRFRDEPLFLGDSILVASAGAIFPCGGASQETKASPREGNGRATAKPCLTAHTTTESHPPCHSCSAHNPAAKCGCRRFRRGSG